MRSTEPALRGYDDDELIEALARGDERVFSELVDAYGPVLLRLAMAHVRTREVAEEVIQETWIGVIRGLDRFQRRCSFRAWVFTILRYTAISRGEREHRTIPMSSLSTQDDDGPVVDPDRFFPPDHPRYPGHWALGPTAWPIPEDRVLAGETTGVITDAIHRLPPTQQAVITLRDVEGWPAQEVCEALDISEVNQRVLLHRARSKVRTAIERHVGAVEPTLDEG
jgi:RNA polymerase sigma-70 factor (ECF subfamily)